MALLVVVCGLGKLIALVANLDLPADRLLFSDAMRGTADGRSNLRAPNAAVNFVLLGAALLLQRGRTHVRLVSVITQILAVLVLLSALIALVAFVYHSGWFESVGRFNRMAAHTAVAFILTSVGVLAIGRERGLLGIMLSDGPGGALARSLLPAGLLVPPIVGWLTLTSRRQSIIQGEVVEMLFVMATTVVFVVLICVHAARLHESHLERVKTEAALRDSETRFRLIAEHGSDLISLHDPSGKVTYVSPSCERVLGFLPEELERVTLLALVHPDDRERLQRHLDALVRGEPVAAIVVRMLHKSGRHVWLESMWRAVMGDDAKVIRLQASSRDVTERKEYERRLEDAQRKLQVQQERLVDANSRLETLASMDALTGVKNRRAFEERLQAEVARTHRSGQVLSLLLLDIDHFKQYNDSFGHPRGDEVLRSVAHLLSRAIRDTDFVARYGGEEFAVLLPDTDRDGAQAMGERLRVAIEAAVWEDRAITVSVGVACLSQGATTGEQLVEHADRALYRSKQNGRNSVTFAA
jgi:diguanylate cyclase (GGDEF)-like protein/PAS domain S-box-containing protein